MFSRTRTIFHSLMSSRLRVRYCIVPVFFFKFSTVVVLTYSHSSFKNILFLSHSLVSLCAHSRLADLKRAPADCAKLVAFEPTRQAPAREAAPGREASGAASRDFVLGHGQCFTSAARTHQLQAWQQQQVASAARRVGRH